MTPARFGAGPARRWPIARNILGQAWRQLRAYGMRSGLTSLGIAFAVAGGVAIASTLASLEASVNRQLASVGDDLVNVKPNWRKLLGDQNLQELRLQDWRLLAHHAKGVRDVTATLRLRTRMPLSYDGRSAPLGVMGVSSQWAALYRPALVEGRPLLPSDDEGHYRVALVTEHAARQLQLPEPMLGRMLNYGPLRLMVVGILPGGDGEQPFQHSDVLISLPVAQEIASEDMQLELAFRLVEPAKRDETVSAAMQLLRQSMGTPTGSDDDVVLQDAREQRRINQMLIATVSAALMPLLVISLVVGGIGVMNVMLVSVAERTREIGLLRALGATRRHIQLQFLAESIVLCIAGTALGLLLGCGLAAIAVTLLPNMRELLIPWWIPMAAALVAIVIGLVAGATPAARAARLDAVTALSAE